jgi:hypothetical protein
MPRVVVARAGESRYGRDVGTGSQRVLHHQRQSGNKRSQERLLRDMPAGQSESTEPQVEAAEALHLQPPTKRARHPPRQPATAEQRQQNVDATATLVPVASAGTQFTKKPRASAFAPSRLSPTSPISLPIFREAESAVAAENALSQGPRPQLRAAGEKAKQLVSTDAKPRAVTQHQSASTEDTRKLQPTKQPQQQGDKEPEQQRRQRPRLQHGQQQDQEQQKQPKRQQVLLQIGAKPQDNIAAHALTAGRVANVAMAHGPSSASMGTCYWEEARQVSKRQ